MGQDKLKLKQENGTVFRCGTCFRFLLENETYREEDSLGPTANKQKAQANEVELTICQDCGKG